MAHVSSFLAWWIARPVPNTEFALLPLFFWIHLWSGRRIQGSCMKTCNHLPMHIPTFYILETKGKACIFLIESLSIGWVSLSCKVQHEYGRNNQSNCFQSSKLRRVSEWSRDGVRAHLHSFHRPVESAHFRIGKCHFARSSPWRKIYSEWM